MKLSLHFKLLVAPRFRELALMCLRRGYNWAGWKCVFVIITEVCSCPWVCVYENISVTLSPCLRGWTRVLATPLLATYSGHFS